MKYYHVCQNWDGSSLETLYDQYADEAYEMFAERWPESGNLGQYHAHVIHLHSNLDEAKQYVEMFGGEILEIAGSDLEIQLDDLEYSHPVCKHEIPKENIKKL